METGYFLFLLHLGAKVKDGGWAGVEKEEEVGYFWMNQIKGCFALFCLNAYGRLWGPHTISNFSYLLKPVSFLDLASFPVYLCIFSQ